MLLTVEGTYQNGQIRLNDDVPFTDERKVIITFLDDDVATDRAHLTIDSFSFRQMREAFRNYKGSFSDEVINERRTSR